MRDGLLLLVEVKMRADLGHAAQALLPRQLARLLRAGELILAAHPDWGPSGVRFDVFLADAKGGLVQIEDAIREM